MIREARKLGVGKGSSLILESAVEEIGLIAGQRPVVGKSQKINRKLQS